MDQDPSSATAAAYGPAVTVAPGSVRPVNCTAVSSRRSPSAGDVITNSGGVRSGGGVAGVSLASPAGTTGTSTSAVSVVVVDGGTVVETTAAGIVVAGAS